MYLPNSLILPSHNNYNTIAIPIPTLCKPNTKSMGNPTPIKTSGVETDRDKLLTKIEINVLSVFKIFLKINHGCL